MRLRLSNQTQYPLKLECSRCSLGLHHSLDGLLGNSTIAAGSPFAITIANDAAATGSAFNISEGVYFIHGNFVTVETETLLLNWLKAH